MLHHYTGTALATRDEPQGYSAARGALSASVVTRQDDPGLGGIHGLHKGLLHGSGVASPNTCCDNSRAWTLRRAGLPQTRMDNIYLYVYKHIYIH